MRQPMRRATIYLKPESFALARELDMTISDLVRVALKELQNNIKNEEARQAIIDKYF